MAIVRPGSTIGILGGGQLGRMTAMAARAMGYHVHVLDPDAECAASAVADRVVAAKFEDAAKEITRSSVQSRDAWMVVEIRVKEVAKFSIRQKSGPAGKDVTFNSARGLI